MQIELPDSLYGWAPILAMGMGLGITYVIFNGWLFFQRRRRRRSPLTQGLLRGPGEALRTAVDDLSTDSLALFFAAFMGPVLVFSIHLSQSYIAGIPETLSRIVISSVLAAAISIYCALKAIKIFAKMRQYQLGLECEIAVGQELNSLLAHGFQVFHDFPAEKFNIDHVVVGPTGVFAIETKGRSKPVRGKGKEDVRVVFDGKQLQFPTWTENAPIEQTRRQAQWLQNWLSRVVGESVYVTPTLAIPGWFIERISRTDMPIYNGKRPDNLFPKYGERRYDQSMIQRISHQLDHRCRDVEIKSDRHTRAVDPEFGKAKA